MILIYNGSSSRTSSFHKKTEKAYSCLTSKDASYKKLTGNIQAFSHDGVPEERSTHQSTVTSPQSRYRLYVTLSSPRSNTN